MIEPLIPFFVLMSAFFAFLLLGTPVFFAMGLASLAFLISAGGDVSFSVLAAALVQGLDSFAFLAIPFFFLAGELMNTGGITRRLLAFASAIVGHIRGGLSHVAVLASMVFSGVSGSSVADATAIGTSLIPAMKKAGYPAEYAAAVVAASATMGPVIPPSIAFVVYAVVTETSIGRLFLAGAIPGILMGVWLIAAGAWIARRRQFPYSERASLRRILLSFRDAIFALMMPVIILGGIVGGVVTPTEAGVVAVVYAAFVGLFIYREMKIADLWGIICKSAINSCMIMILIASAGIFSWLVANIAIGEVLVESLTSITDSRIVMLLIINVFFIIWGLALEAPVAMVTMVPLLVPIAHAYDIDLIHLGVIVVLNLMIGQLTPPSGVLTFLTAQMANAPVVSVFRAEIPFGVALLIVLMLVTFFPVIPLWLPGLLMPTP